jgi:hypothetical protein
LREHGREDTYQIAQVASLLWLAGEGDAARPWLERALAARPGLNVAAALQHLLGEHDRAAALAREAAEDPDDRPYPWAEAVEALAIARRDGEGDRAARARQTFADLIRQERTPPFEESGSANLSLFDWYEHAARTEAELSGEPPPGYDELLARLAG